jgi:preprotein translocase subunit SecF
MELLKTQTNIDFMSQRKLALIFSGLLLLVSLVSFGVRGLNFGIDFTGGTLIEVGFPESADLVTVRADLADAGFNDAVVQFFGTTQDVLVRLAPTEDLSKAELSSSILRVLRKSGGEGMQLRRVEFVGPQVGEELTEQGGLAMLIALGAILLYVSLRFQWKFSLGAVAALFHDVIITIGFFSVLGLQFDLTVLAAVLAVIGYSLNDTIVVFDRVRENFRTMRKGTPIQIVNASLNQTLSRTVMTSLTTLLVLVALFFLGGELIHEFATALIVGVVIGTYSSIYVASTSALALGVMKADLMPVQKEGSEADARP